MMGSPVATSTPILVDDDPTDEHVGGGGGGFARPPSRLPRIIADLMLKLPAAENIITEEEEFNREYERAYPMALRVLGMSDQPGWKDSTKILIRLMGDSQTAEKENRSPALMGAFDKPAIGPPQVSWCCRVFATHTHTFVCVCRN